MCSIFGVSADPKTSELSSFEVCELMRKCRARGRDGIGYLASVGKNVTEMLRHVHRDAMLPSPLSTMPTVSAPKHIGDLEILIGNCRAEPTTEYVENKKITDQQPYGLGPVNNGWVIVHNGTIANDKELRTNEYPSSIDSAAIVERLVYNEAKFPDETHTEIFKMTMRELKGSFAVLAYREGSPNLYTAANYRPIWMETGHGYSMFASSRDAFVHEVGVCHAVMLPAYTINVFRHGTHINTFPLNTAGKPLDLVGAKFLVVCSGGLDSTVAAKWACEYGDKVELLHFLYGSRAEKQESDQVIEIANALSEDCEGVKFINMQSLYDPEDSPLLRDDSTIAGGEAGAEFAHEWVPARNLVMLSVATAYAEAKGFDFIVLGNNLEEAGAYPDNEPEFIDRFNDILPFAVGDGKRVRVLMPVGNLMKHEIVAMGHDLGAPMHLTWSCYRAGEKHCGTCGPCYMRRKAFEMNNLPEVIEYEA